MNRQTESPLWEKYRKGTLSASEREELNRLSHRDEVMQAASARAATIVARRRSVFFAIVGLVVVGAAAVWMLQPTAVQGPVVAEAVVEQPLPSDTDVLTLPVEKEVEVAMTTHPEAAMTERQRATRPTVRNSAQAAKAQPVVVCNNQCEADSVISDIWKFLSA